MVSMKRLFLAFALVLLSSANLLAAFAQIDFTTQVGGKPTTMAGYGITDGVSDSDLTTHEADQSTHGCTVIASAATVTAHEADQSTHGCSEIASTSLVTTHTAAPNGVHGLAAGVAVVGASSTQTLTNKSISGEQINSGTVADARVASTIARDTEVSTAVGNHAALQETHGCTVIASASAVALKADKLSAAKRASVTMGAAGATVDFAGTPVPSTIEAAVIAINGLIQPEGTFTRTDNNTIVSTAGNIPAGAVVTILNLE